MTRKVALVTGASRGIGRAIATALAQVDYEVLGTATTAAGAAEVTAMLAATGGKGYTLNLADPDSTQALLQAIKAGHDAPLVLVNNAGITRDNLALRMKDAEWDAVITTNLSGIFRVTKGLLRGMTKARWGRIINLSSVIGSMGNPGQSNYAAAKAGIEGYSRSLAAELGGRGITVNAIAPGLVATDMTATLDEAQKTILVSRIPVGRLGTPEEVAGLCVYLASEAAGYITGETIHINGGMYMH